MKKLLLSLAVLLFLGVSYSHEPIFNEGVYEVEEWMTTPFSSIYNSTDDFVIIETDELFPYQGITHEVYNVYYDDPTQNIKIAVNEEENSYIAYTDEYMVFYSYSRKNGFGVRRVLFTSADVRDEFCCEEFNHQTILFNGKKIEKKTAINMVAHFMPRLKTDNGHV